jgi:hypothetical protein
MSRSFRINRGGRSGGRNITRTSSSLTATDQAVSWTFFLLALHKFCFYFAVSPCLRLAGGSRPLRWVSASEWRTRC